MTVHAIGQIAIVDRERYARYASRFPPILTRHGGRLLAADEAPEVLSGRWPYRKVIVVEFPDCETLYRWEGSEEYREIAVDRIAGDGGDSIARQGPGKRRRLRDAG